MLFVWVVDLFGYVCDVCGYHDDKTMLFMDMDIDRIVRFTLTFNFFYFFNTIFYFIIVNYARNVYVLRHMF